MRNVKYVVFLLFALVLFFGCKSKPEPKIKEQVKEPVVVEEPVVEQVVEEVPEQIGVYTVYFAPESYAIDYLTAGKLERIIEEIKKEGATGIKVVGHSAKLDNERAEERIALKRAKAVADYLDKTGRLDGLDISIESVGASEPVSPHNDITGRTGNRRVEIKIEK